MRKAVTVILIVLLVNAQGVAVSAPLPPPTLTSLVTDADLIAAGTVADISVYPATDNSTIYTFVTLKELDVVDGAYAGPSLTLRLEGGELRQSFFRKRGMRISGMPEFAAGDRVLVFIRNNTQAVCPLVAGELGVFRLKATEPGSLRVFSYRSGIELAGIKYPAEAPEFLFKPALQQTEGVKVVDDTATANELRLQFETAQEDRWNQVRALSYSYAEFRGVIQELAEKLRTAGAKLPAEFVNANPEQHRPGKGPIRAVAPNL